MLSIQSVENSTFKTYLKQLSILLVTAALIVFAWANILFQADTCANAATLDGVTDQIEGKVQEGFGTVERNKGDLLDNGEIEAKGGVNELKGNAKQGLGTAKNQLDDAANTAEEKSESLIDSVKDIFN